MEKILVVEDGTDTSTLIYENLQTSLRNEHLETALQRLQIRRESQSGLSATDKITEFRGDPGHLAESIGDTTIVLVHLAPVSAEVIQRAPYLKLIGTARSSVSNIEVGYAAGQQIPVIYCPGRNAQTVAEFTIGLMLDLMRSITKGHTTVLQEAWDVNLKRQAFTGPELQGKTLGLIGFGQIGQAVASIALGFGMSILYYDPIITLESPKITKTSLSEVLRRSDILSLHAKGTPETPLLGPAEFAQMKPGVYLINTARGCFLDEQALVQVLRNGTIAGAALDVFETEPLPADSPLRAAPNVLLTPHLAGLSTDMGFRSATMLVEDTLRFLKGEEPLRRYIQS